MAAQILMVVERRIHEERLAIRCDIPSHYNCSIVRKFPFSIESSELQTEGRIWIMALFPDEPLQKKQETFLAPQRKNEIFPTMTVFAQQESEFHRRKTKHWVYRRFVS